MAEKNVRIRLFKDNSRYKGDLFVSVNGVNYKIRRGVEVEVPPEVAEVLEHSQQHIVAHCRHNHARQALTKQQPTQPCVRRAAEELPSAAEQRAEGCFISFCLHFSSSFGA